MLRATPRSRRSAALQVQQPMTAETARTRCPGTGHSTNATSSDRPVSPAGAANRHRGRSTADQIEPPCARCVGAASVRT